MKKRILLTSILIAAALMTGCEKENEPKDLQLDGGEVSGIWEKGSTITVTGHITIPEGESLTIEEGVTVMMTDTAAGQEILVYGNLYCLGTGSAPVKFTVPEDKRKPGSFPRLWGGILCAPSCKELLLEHTMIEFTGYVTTEDSPSVKAGLFKAAAGEGLPAINTKNNIDGKVVIMNCTFNNIGEDAMYLEGGSAIVSNNLFYTQGETGGDGVNVKAGTIIDVCYNVFYSPNTNGLKLSNTGDRSPQCHIVGYNNTIVNAGWRRPTVKGGGIWLESGVYAELFNNLHINCRFGIKNNSKDAADIRSIYDYSYYFGYTQECVDNFQSGVKDVVRGTHDIGGNTAGANNPMLVSYPLNTDVNNAVYNQSWNFHLQAGSPALTGGKTDFTRNYGTTGIVINGKTYKSPAPAAWFGAFGTI